MEKSKEIYLFHQGTYYHAYNLLGCHFKSFEGAYFRCWAPNAENVSVVGDFNEWNSSINPMKKISNNGLWEVFISNVNQFDNYKYCITTRDGSILLKADPYAFYSETNGATASKVYEFENFNWNDKIYYENNQNKNHQEMPMNIYEVNFASWKKTENGDYFTYKMLADELVKYVKEMGYTHIEIMPLTEYPFDGSWGYQVTGYFSVTSRFGTPDDFKYFVNKCHENNIGVILDWVPAHFPKDEHGLCEWDGSYLYENQGWDRIEHYNWGTRRFDYGRTEVQSFLISSAMFFIDIYHIDGIRVDAVASMLYLDYDKKDGEWIPNQNGDNKNLEAIAFLQKLNSAILTKYPNVLMIAEESTAWPMVTKPAYIGGLGFNYKWNMGWMNDALDYVSIDPFFRKDNHDKLTFSMFYAFSENFILPISHDELVHGKRSLLNKMYGDYYEKFEAMKTFLMYMFAHPGKKLTFMGTEFAQFDEWNNSKGIDFMLLDYDTHRGVFNFMKKLNHIYLENSELYEIDYSWEGFRWLTPNDKNNNVVAFERKNKKGDILVFVANFSPVKFENYRVGVEPGKYITILNSNEKEFGGSGKVTKYVSSDCYNINGFDNSIEITLEPYSAIYFKKQEFCITIESKVNYISKNSNKSDIIKNINNQDGNENYLSDEDKIKNTSDMIEKIISFKQNNKDDKLINSKINNQDEEELKELISEKRKPGRPKKNTTDIIVKEKRKTGRPRKNSTK